MAPPVSSINAKSSGSETDPARHPFDVLAAFVKTFANDEDIQVSPLIMFTTASC
jgi:hypothetical protein